MDFNIVVLCGRIATSPDVRSFESGAVLVRYLVTVRAMAPRRRVDVVPVTLWDPTDDILAAPGEVDDRVWVVGSVQRRFWEAEGGRRSRVEIVAHSVQQAVDPEDARIEAALASDG